MYYNFNRLRKTHQAWPEIVRLSANSLSIVPIGHMVVLEQTPECGSLEIRTNDVVMVHSCVSLQRTNLAQVSVESTISEAHHFGFFVKRFKYIFSWAVLA